MILIIRKGVLIDVVLVVFLILLVVYELLVFIFGDEDEEKMCVFLYYVWCKV